MYKSECQYYSLYIRVELFVLIMPQETIFIMLLLVYGFVFPHYKT